MSAKVQVQCPCGEPLSVQVEMLGKQGTCPACDERFLIWSQDVAKTAGDRNWYVKLDGRPRGPVSFIELRRLVSEGRVERDTPVRFGHEGDWIPAREARGDIDVEVPTEAVRRARVRRAGPGRTRRKPKAPPLDPQQLRLGAAVLVVAVLVVVFLLVMGDGDDEGGPKRLTTSELASRTLPSVAVVRGRRGAGSGFVIAPGTLVTNYHVIERELLRNVVVEFPNARGSTRGYEPTLRYADRDADLAFLAIDAEVTPLSLADTHTFKPGQEILIVGSPGLGGGRVVLRNAVTRGILSTELELDGQTYYQLDAAVNPGNSGGPVVDERGAVIGVVNAKAKDQERLAFAIPLREIQLALVQVDRMTDARARSLNARHRLDVAQRAVLPAALVYHRVMAAYALGFGAAAARADTEGAEAALQRFLKELDRHLLADLRLEEREIAKDKALTASERERFQRLWRLFAELRSAVDNPQGTFTEYAEQCKKLGERLKVLQKEIDATR